MRKKLILICDTKNEIDDQFAIVYALKSPEIDLLAVVSTQNNRRNDRKSLELYHKEAQKILKLSGAKIPALKGASRPIFKFPEKSEGVQFIIDCVAKSRTPIYIVSTGPATDLVNVIKLAPRTVDKAKFIWLGGYKHEVLKRFERYETNFAGDPVAAKELLKIKKNLTVVPTFGVSHALVANTKKLRQRLINQPLPITRYLSGLIEWNRHRFNFNRTLLRPLRNFWIFSDLAAVAVVLGKDFVKIEKGVVTKINSRKILLDFARKVLE